MSEEYKSAAETKGVKAKTAPPLVLVPTELKKSSRTQTSLKPAAASYNIT